MDGLLLAQKTANDRAAAIIKTTTLTAEPPSQARQPTNIPPTSGERPPSQTLQRENAGFLVQQLVEFKAAEFQFLANASVFKSIVDTDESATDRIFEDEA